MHRLLTIIAIDENENKTYVDISIIVIHCHSRNVDAMHRMKICFQQFANVLIVSSVFKLCMVVFVVAHIHIVRD